MKKQVKETKGKKGTKKVVKNDTKAKKVVKEAKKVVAPKKEEKQMYLDVVEIRVGNARTKGLLLPKEGSAFQVLTKDKEAKPSIKSLQIRNEEYQFFNIEKGDIIKTGKGEYKVKKVDQNAIHIVK